MVVAAPTRRHFLPLSASFYFVEEVVLDLSASDVFDSLPPWSHFRLLVGVLLL